MQDQLIANGHWSFNADVTSVFDDMLARSIPQYDLMRSTVAHIGSIFINDSSTVIDLGCSRGEALIPFMDSRCIGIEISEPMYQAAQERFSQHPRIEIRQQDLRTYYPPEIADLTLAILTLQFVPIEYRQRIVRSVYKHTAPGGAFILVEKVLGSTADLDALMVREYYGMKAQNGYTQEQIERKRLSLEGVLVPVTARWNEELLTAAGFTQVDSFWRWMNFAGWIAIKE